MKNIIVLGFLILLITSCGTKTVHKTIVRKPAIVPRKISHLDCVKELLAMDVNSKRANEICISIFRKGYKDE